MRHSCANFSYFNYNNLAHLWHCAIILRLSITKEPPIIIVGGNELDLCNFNFRQKFPCCFSIISPCLFQRFGKLLGMCKDPLKGTIWAYTSQSVFKYKVIREARWVKLKQCQNIHLLVNKSQIQIHGTKLTLSHTKMCYYEVYEYFHRGYIL